MIMSIPNTIPQKCGTAFVRSRLDVQVLSAAGIFVRLGKSRDELLNSLPLSGVQGNIFDSTAGIVERQWLGEVWVCGIAANATQAVIDLEVTPT